jgi:hypothetical protein
VKKLQDSILIIFTSTMAFLTTSSSIVVQNSPRSFWQSLFKILKVKIKLPFAYHLHIDGQIERVNQVLEQYLLCTINFYQDNWIELLPFAEFAYNNTIQGSIHLAPFFANYRYHLKFDQFDFNNVENPSARDLTT